MGWRGPSPDWVRASGFPTQKGAARRRQGQRGHARRKRVNVGLPHGDPGPPGTDRESPCGLTLPCPLPRLRPTRSNVSTSRSVPPPTARMLEPEPRGVGHEGSWPVEGTGRWIPGWGLLWEKHDSSELPPGGNCLCRLTWGRQTAVRSHTGCEGRATNILCFDNLIRELSPSQPQ